MANVCYLKACLLPNFSYKQGWKWKVYLTKVLGEEEKLCSFKGGGEGDHQVDLVVK